MPVLVNLPLSPDLVARIAGVDPRLRVFEAFLPGEADKEEPGERTRRDQNELEPLLAQAEVMFTFGVSREFLDSARNLKWLQLASAGVDHIVRQGIMSELPGVLVTTASGIHEVPISEHILGMMLYFARGFDGAIRNQRQHRWERYRGGELAGATVCLVGYGPIARRAAMLCSAAGMRVLCVRASITGEQPGEGPIAAFYPASELNRALAQSDYVVVAAPRTPRSEGMIGGAQFGAMKPGAVLVNISRGALVDEEALVEALREGRLRGAGLDVFTQEPLPESSPLWDMPNVLVTPHVSGSNPHYDLRATELFCDNLARYLAGQPLRNLVDLERGY